MPPLGFFGRGSRIRTDDHLSPRQVRYQAALYPGMAWIIPASRAAPRLPVQRRSSWRISSSSIRTCLTIWVLSADSCFAPRSEEHTSELQSLMRISYAVFCLKKKNQNKPHPIDRNTSQQNPHHKRRSGKL